MKQFKVNNFFTLKLEDGKTNIYIKGELFQQCKFLLLNIPVEKISSFDEINSIDEVEERLDKSLEINNQEFNIPAETEFWGHCSNLQVWAEMEYDTRLLHRNLAFPLLKRLTEVGDHVASNRFKEEIARRYKYGNYTVQAYLFDGGYLSYLSDNDILNGILSAEDAIFMEKIIHRENYSLIPCFDLIRDLDRSNKLFFSIENGKLNEIEILLDEYFKSIPNEIKNLKYLYKLTLYITDECDNLFGDEFRVDSVMDFVISCDKYTNIPDLFYYFPNLKYLRIHGYQCKPKLNIEKSLGYMKELVLLNIINVNILSIPDSVKNLKKLRWMKLINLPIEDLPISEIEKLQSLELLDISENYLLKISENQIKKLEKKIQTVNYF